MIDRLSLRRAAVVAGFAAAVSFGSAAAHASGCGVPVRPGATTVAVRTDGRDRPVHVRVPAGYDPARPAPLLLDLHGSGSDGRGQRAVSRLDAAADRHGVIVATPDGGVPLDRGFAWNVPGVPTVAGTIPGPEAADDARYLVAVVDAAAAALCVDRTRVYATGLSGGGRMASWLGCVAAERFAAIAPVVGLRAGRALPDAPDRVDTTTCAPARPVAVLAFAGARDRTNPVEGGEGARWGYSMATALQRWATLDGCAAALPTEWIDVRRYHQRYAGCRGGARVEAVIDREGGHDWNVVDNDRMLAFLLSHRLAPARR